MLPSLSLADSPTEIVLPTLKFCPLLKLEKLTEGGLFVAGGVGVGVVGGGVGVVGGGVVLPEHEVAALVKL